MTQLKIEALQRELADLKLQLHAQMMLMEYLAEFNDSVSGTTFRGLYDTFRFDARRELYKVHPHVKAEEAKSS